MARFTPDVRLLAVPLACIIGTTTWATDLPVRKILFNPDGGVSIEVPTAANTYLVLMRGDSPWPTDSPVDALLPAAGELTAWLRDPQIRQSSFYTVRQFSITDPADSDGDGIDDLFELNHPLLLSAVDPGDGAEDGDGDGESNFAEFLAGTDPAETRESNVTFRTSDRLAIRATLRIPAARHGATLPAVILIHQGGSSRNEWSPYADAFNAAGYISLAYDIRGHGQSTGTFSSADFDDPNTTPKDLQAAINYLNSRGEVDPSRLGVVGASIGGNLACVASQKNWVKTAVNLSGKTSAVQNLAAHNNLQLDTMFHIASSGDGGGQRAVWANELHGFTRSSRLVEVVPNSSAHGVAIFNSDPDLVGRIINWLRETL